MEMATAGFVGLLPPSVNEMYVYTTRGPRPSAKMKKFKSAASSEILKQLDFNQEPLLKDVAYKLHLDFYMPSLFNKGYPKKAKTKYKRRDVTNLVKVFEDLICDVYGIDDSQFLEVTLKKRHGPKYDKVGVTYRIEQIEDLNIDQ
tara:strand:- start:1230 stop:1664 length:435 start_codon:yes stop_codon:yes gene_type:complete